jgi:hypothetical protein
MRGTKLNDGGPDKKMFFASVTYHNDLALFQGACSWTFPENFLPQSSSSSSFSAVPSGTSETLVLAFPSSFHPCNRPPIRNPTTDDNDYKDEEDFDNKSTN